MNDIALTPEYLEHLLALGKAVPAGPWGTSLNAFELFGKDFTDWGEVYANLTLDNGHVFKGSVIAHANTNLVSEEEKIAAREAYLKGEKVDPGLSGKLAAYIAAYHPGVTTALILEILRLHGEVKRLNKEADWIAKNSSGCPPLPAEYRQNCDSEYHPCDYCWRKAAQKAVEKKL